MLSKISNEKIVKGYIYNYQKIKDDFKNVLKIEDFKWYKGWERFNTFSREGV